MCLISIAWKVSEEYPFAMAANRDEFLQRKTQPMHFWQSNPDILAGRDLEAGGTWMGFSKQGRFAALTNIRHPDYFKQGDKSRGVLIPDFLTTKESIAQWAQKLSKTYQDYHGFNLIFGDKDHLFYFGSHAPVILQLPPGVYGLCNADLDTPWPKLELAKQQMQQWLPMTDIKSLSQIHSSERTFPDTEIPSTGISIEMERSLSAQKITLENYGTRAQTGAILSKDGRLQVNEVNLDQHKLNQWFTIDHFGTT